MNLIETIANELKEEFKDEELIICYDIGAIYCYINNERNYMCTLHINNDWIISHSSDNNSWLNAEYMLMPHNINRYSLYDPNCFNDMFTEIRDNITLYKSKAKIET